MRILFIFWGLLILKSSNSSVNAQYISHADDYLSRAESLIEKGNYIQASYSADSAQKVFSQLGEWSKVLECLDRKARIYDYLDKLEKRLETLEFGFEIAQRYLETEQVVLGKLYQQKAETLIALGDYRLARSNLACAKYIYDLNQSTEEYLWVLILEAVINYYDQQYRLMEDPLEEVLLLSYRSHDDNYQIKSTAYQLLTILYEELGDVRKAIDMGKKSLALRQSQPQKNSSDSLYIITTHDNLGILYYQLGDNISALREHEEASRIIATLKIPIPIRKAMNRNAMGKLVDLETAKTLYKQNLDIKIPNFSEARRIKFLAHYNLAANFFEEGEYLEAKNALADAKLLYEPSPHLVGFDITLLNARINFVLKNYKFSKNLFDKSIVEFDTTFGPSHPKIALAHTYLGELELAQEDPMDAICEAQQAISILIPSFDSTHTFDISTNPLHPATISRKTLLKAFELKMKALRQMHDADSQQKYLENAFEVSELSVVLLDSMRQDLQEDNARQELMARTLNVYEQGIALAWQLYQHSQEESYLVKAFEISEKSKAVLLLNQFRKDEAIAFGNIPDSLLQKERDLRLELLFYEGELAEVVKGDVSIAHKTSHWEKKIFDLKEAHRQLLDTFAVRYPAYHRIKYETAVATVESVRELLPEEAAWIQFFAGTDHFYVFGLTQDQIRLHRLDRNPKRILDFVAALGEPEYAYDPVRFEAWTQAGFQLYQELLEPVMASNIHRITIVPDGEVAFLPFEVLMQDSVPPSPVSYQDLPYLLRQASIHYDYSATLHAKAGKWEKRVAREAFAGFAPTFSSSLAASEGIPLSFTDLRYNQLEIERIAEKKEGWRTYLGEAATEKSFQEQAGDFQILHLATHARTDDENPWLSGLAFAREPESNEDGFLHAHEICRMDIRAQLAVLSACNTAQGQMHPGDGVMSLAWAFKFAGCPSIIMSQWQVDDAATHLIMSNLYGNLKSGTTTAEALRKAKLEFLENSPRVHPYYWSAFVFLGQDKQIEWMVPWYQKPLFWGVMALLLFAIGLGYYQIATSEA